MIPNKKPRSVTSHGVGQSGEFGISLENSAHIMTILRDTLYSDKVLAVLREYSTNAWDEHQESGIPNTPIKIILPTDLEPTLSIRDFGRGLSQEDVFKIYTQYGESTKRNSDKSAGFLGIGCKSGFAYSDTFTITSFHGGLKKVYVAVLDKSDKGEMKLLHEEPSTETGVLFQIAIHPNDIWEFTEKAKKFYAYFFPRPDINIKLPPLPTVQADLKNGVIYDMEDNPHAHGWTAVMGCVPYKIDLNQLRVKNRESIEDEEDAHGNKRKRLTKILDDGISSIPDFINRISGVLYFGIGEVEISASREELKYNTDTKKLLVERFNALVDEYVQTTLDGIKAGNLSLFQQRVKAQVLNELGLPVPEDYVNLCAGDIKLDEDEIEMPKMFSIWRDKAGASLAHRIDIHGKARFLIRDDNRAIEGFGLTGHDYIIRAAPKSLDKKSSKKFSWGEVQDELNVFIERVGLTGIPVLKCSEMDWFKPTRRYDGKVINPKHSQRVFKLRGGSYSNGGSSNWDSITHTPSPTDVFVVISFFESEGGFDIFADYRNDAVIARDLGIKMPDVIGYKNTVRKPITPKDCMGTHYPDWRVKFVKDLATGAKVRKLLDLWSFAKLTESELSQSRYKHVKRKYREVQKVLGKNHPVVELLRNNSIGISYFRRDKNRDLASSLENLANRVASETGVLAGDKAFDVLKIKYHLFGLTEFTVSDLWDEAEGSKWVQYIKSMDELAALKERNTAPALAATTVVPVEGDTDASTTIHTDQRVDHGCLGGNDSYCPEGTTAVPCPEEGNSERELEGHPQSPDRCQEPERVGQGEVYVPEWTVSLQR